MLKSTYCLLFSIFIHTIGFTQPLEWRTEVLPGEPDEVILSFTAQIMPGWHLYSQFMEDGGPIPTRFTFAKNDAYVLAGNTREEGAVIRHYDSLYQMDIAWFTHTVTFYQSLRIKKPLSQVSEKVLYMVCNDHVCVPGEKTFTITIKTK